MDVEIEAALSELDDIFTLDKNAEQKKGSLSESLPKHRGASQLFAPVGSLELLLNGSVGAKNLICPL